LGEAIRRKGGGNEKDGIYVSTKGEGEAYGLKRCFSKY